MANEKNLKNFRDNPENINRKGRPPLLVNALIKKLKADGYNAVTKSQVIDCFQFMLNLPQEKVKEVALDVLAPMMMRVVAKQMLSSKGHDMIEKMLDRSHGKASITANIEHSGEIKTITGMTVK